jgi:hypothetical protein
MENLKDEGKFKSRADFTSALHKYALGSFGNHDKFKMIRDSACIIEYKCRDCTAEPNIRVRVHREIIESEKNGKPEKKSVRRGDR